MESTKSKFLSREEILKLIGRGDALNPIDELLWLHEPVHGDKYRDQVYAAVNYEDEETRADRNTNVVAQFMEHCKENGLEIPDSFFESFFDA